MNDRVDLSCDLGEARNDEETAVENAIWPLISAANVACGGHVGDEKSMRVAIAKCEDHEVILGAHPSYPDREGFDRKSIEITIEALVSSLSSQLALFRSLAAERRKDIERVKPHGALYNDAHRNSCLAEAVVSSVAQVLPRAAIVCADGSEVDRASREAGLAVVREAFVDRRYLSNASLQPRSEAGSLLTDPEAAADQALRLAASGHVIAADGAVVRLTFETLCAHSDMPGSVERIQRVCARLAAAGFEVRRGG